MGCISSQQKSNIKPSRHNRISFQQNKEYRLNTCKEKIQKNYVLDAKLIGSGSFANVRKGTQIDSGMRVAIKTIKKKKSKEEQESFLEELSILQHLDHPNIIKFYEVYEETYYYHFVMEYCGGGDLAERLEKLDNYTESQAAQILQPIFQAVNYLHSVGVCHRDIKLDNVMFLNKNHSDIKLIDFGLASKLRSKKQMQQLLGTPIYIAPEVFSHDYDLQVDVWSLGVMMYYMLCGYPPFMAQNMDDLQEAIINSPLIFRDEQWDNISVTAQILIQKMLQKDPDQRITIEEALNDNWFKKNIKNTYKIQKIKTINNVDLVKNLVQNQKMVKLKKIIYQYMINFLTESELKEIKQSFNLIDTDHSGSISVSELKELLQKSGKNNNEVLEIFQGMSEDNLTINFTDFIIAALDKNKYMNSEYLKEIFRHFDTSNNDYITIEDLQQIFSRSGKEYSLEQIEEMIKDFDIKKDGKISKQEFIQIMTKEENLTAQQILQNADQLKVKNTK